MAVMIKNTTLWDVTLFTGLHGQRKAIPIAAWTGLEGFRKLGLPDFKTVSHESGKVVSLTHRPEGLCQ